MKAYYDNNKSAWVEKESRDVRPILIAVADKKDGKAFAAAKAVAQKAYEALKKGGDFETIAHQFETKAREPMHLMNGSSPTELVGPAFQLNVGEIAKPVRTSAGYYVMRLLAKNPERSWGSTTSSRPLRPLRRLRTRGG